MAAFPVLPAPPCTSFSPSSIFLTPCSSDGRSTAPRAAAVRGSAATWAQRTLSARWVPSGLAAARPAARKARLEELDTSNMLLRQRIVFLGSPVDDTSADLVISQLLLLDAEDQTKDIKLFINSPGGSITAGMGVYDAMKFCKADVSTVCFGLAASMGAFLLAAGTKGMGVYDAMKFCKADVSTVCFGLAASMGAFLLAAGTKGKRYCMPNARIMIHQPSGGAGGKVTEMGLQIREMMYEKIKINKIMSRITGKSEEQIDEDTKFDYFMSPWEAKDYGIVDSIIDEGKRGLVAPFAGSVPPPKSRVWYLWKASGPTRKIMKHLPSEEKLIHNGNGSATGDDGKLKEASAT